MNHIQKLLSLSAIALLLAAGNDQTSHRTVDLSGKLDAALGVTFN